MTVVQGDWLFTSCLRTPLRYSLGCEHPLFPCQTCRLAYIMFPIINSHLSLSYSRLGDKHSVARSSVRAGCHPPHSPIKASDSTTPKQVSCRHPSNPQAVLNCSHESLSGNHDYLVALGVAIRSSPVIWYEIQARLLMQTGTPSSRS